MATRVYEVAVPAPTQIEPLGNAVRNMVGQLRAIASDLEVRYSGGINGILSSGVFSMVEERFDEEMVNFAELVQKIREQRQLFFPAQDLFAEPAWDMTLDLVVSTLKKRKVSVMSLCIASAVPPTTALRWIAVMERLGLVTRVEDPKDRRRTWIEATPKLVDSFRKYFAHVYSKHFPKARYKE